QDLIALTETMRNQHGSFMVITGKVALLHEAAPVLSLIETMSPRELAQTISRIPTASQTQQTNTFQQSSLLSSFKR
ncbi:4405_t:CDS:2, partial [Dentiscutata heterogama]